MKILAGDIGGTKTLLQIAKVHQNEVEVLNRSRFASQEFADFESLLRAYLDANPNLLTDDIAGACFGIAGPVQGTSQGTRRAQVTNLPWLLDEARLQTHLRLPSVHLINDFYATACGIEGLVQDDLAVLQSATAQEHAPRLVIGAGTGLGVAQLLWCDGRYHPFASEGGHIQFAPTDELQVELLQFMKRRHGRVSYERLVSGHGLIAIYTFLAQRDGAATDEQSSVLETTDPAAAVVAHARQGNDHARNALELFLTIYGSVVGDMALVNLPYGGIYIAGGIAPKLLAEMRNGPFIKAFNEKGRMSPLVMNMPINIITNQEVGLLGATLVPSRL